MDDLERLRHSPLPFAAPLGILFPRATQRLTAELLVRDNLCTRPAIPHGGAIMAFADMLAGTTTIESEINFPAAAPVGTKIRGEMRSVYRVRRTRVWQTRVTTETGRAIALVTRTQLVIEPRGYN